MPVTPSGDDKRPAGRPKARVGGGVVQSAGSLPEPTSTHPQHVLPSPSNCSAKGRGQHRKRLAGKKWDSREQR